VIPHGLVYCRKPKEVPTKTKHGEERALKISRGKIPPRVVVLKGQKNLGEQNECPKKEWAEKN
jgi:hypothetical protein